MQKTVRQLETVLITWAVRTFAFSDILHTNAKTHFPITYYKIFG